jgi:16S rRNA processing protein RimM
MDEFIEIGYTRKPHGLAGEIKIVINEPYSDVIFDLEKVFLEIRGKKLPYFLQQVRGGGALIASFEDIDDRDDALAISAKSIWAKAVDLPEIELDPVSDEINFVGFEIFDLTSQQNLGKITEVIEYPQQLMAVIFIEERQVLIPLNHAFISAIDEAESLLKMELPDGLLEL